MHGRFLLRVCLAALAAVLVSAGWEASRLAAAQRSPSLLLSATPLIAWLGAALAAGGMLAPRSWVDRLQQGLNRWQPAEELNREPRSRLKPGVIALIAAAMFAAVATVSLWNPSDPTLDDQQAFIELAWDIRSGGGLPMLWYRMQTGEFDEANRHPLYPWLLSHWPDAQSGRFLSLGLAVLTGLTCGWMIARRFGALTAAIFLLLLAMNRSFSDYATSVVCESLMILLGGLAWLTLLPPRGRDAPPRIMARLLLASAFLGAMYLTKATGLLYFGVYLLWLAWEARPRFEAPGPPTTSAAERLLPADAPYQLRRMAIVLAFSLAAFLVVAHPLIVRNVRRFGNPFHNVNSLLLFADNYSEFDEMLLTQQTTAKAAKNYFATHTPAQMLSREVSGLAWETFIMLRALGPHGLDDARVLIGIPLALCCLLSLLADPRPANSLLAAWIIMSAIVFAWYVPIAAGDRFPIPLLVPVLAHAAHGIVQLATRR